MSRVFQPLKAGDAVEYYPYSWRDLTRVAWHPGVYVKPHTTPDKRGWHLVRAPSGNIVSVPRRRVRPLVKR